MTNLIAAISITLSTNWHKLGDLDIEAQVVKREVSATMVFEGKTNVVNLKTTFECLPGVRMVTVATTTNIFVFTNLYYNGFLLQTNQWILK